MPEFPQPALVSLSRDHGYVSLGHQTFAWVFSLPQSHPFHIARLQQSDKPRIFVCCIFHLFPWKSCENLTKQEK